MMENSLSAPVSLRIGIIGASEEKWDKLLVNDVKKTIRDILVNPHYYCVECGWNFKYPHVVSHVDKGLVKELKVQVLVSGGCPYGGVDIWAEAIAKELGIKTRIFKPQTRQWENKIVVTQSGVLTFIGYKERNIEIAKSCDILYVISPRCQACGGTGVHSSDDLGGLCTNTYCEKCKGLGYTFNGGVWTGNYAAKSNTGVKVVRIMI